MNPDFSSLFRFLEAVDKQVTGRSSDRPNPEIEARLRRLLNGEVPDEEERKHLFQALRDHPNWMAWLAEQVKARRTNPPRKES